MSDYIWLPKSDEEMKQFEEFAETAFGPYPVWIYVFRTKPARLAKYKNVSWREYFKTARPGEGTSPAEFARSLVKAARKFNFGAWNPEPYFDQEGRPPIYRQMWLPETDKEMKKFEEFAERSPGPNALFRRIYLWDPVRKTNYKGMSWKDFFKLGNRGDATSPRKFARALVEVTRQFDLPKWDRRHIPPPEPKTASNLTSGVSWQTPDAGDAINN